MSMPPNPPFNQPYQPPRSSKNNKWTGAIAAVVFVVFLSLLIGLAGAITTEPQGPVVIAGLFSPLVALVAVVGGAFGTISERYRQFAVGFLIASAVLIFVSAGACISAFSSTL